MDPDKISTVSRLLAGLLVGLPFLLASPSSAQSVADHPRVVEALDVAAVWLDAQRDYEQIPGLSASVVHDQETVWSAAFGLAHRDRGEPATPATIYSICSISKLFTAIALMQLRDRGRVELSDPVSKHLDWFDLRQAHPDAALVTVEGILTHSAGLPRESAHPYWSAPDFNFPTREEIIEGIADQETLYPAWRYFQYSNLGLTLAGEIVRESSGMSYEDYVQQNILDPLGLQDTRPRMPEELRGGQLASGYSAPTRDGIREPVPFFQARGIAPAAGYTSTVEDLADFARWMFRLEGRDEEVLHAHTLREMQRVHYVDPDFDTYWGLGFAVMRSDGETFVGHGGSCPGYRSQIMLDMDDRVATVVMANASGVNAGGMARGIHRLVAPALEQAVEDGDRPTATDEPEDTATAPDLEKYLGLYTVFPWGGELAVVRWKGGLAYLDLPTSDPVRALTKLRHVEGNTFRRVRDDDELGERIVFETDAAGEVTAILQFENRWPRTGPLP